MTTGLLIACPKTLKAAIVDAPPDSANDFLGEIKKLKLKPQMILLTHSHWDHMADAALLKKKLEIPVYVHKLDSENLKNPGADLLPLLFPIDGVEPDHFLEEGEKLSIGDLHLEVIHTPGHSPGGVCLYFPDEGVLISGDTLFRGSIGNVSFPSSEPEKMWTSLERLAQLPKETRVIPGHGEETTIGRETWLENAKEYFGG